MRVQLGLIVALTLAAGPAVAQSAFAPGKKPGSPFGFGPQPGASAAKPGSYLPGTPPASSQPRTYGAPQAPSAPGFTPYQPFTGSSVYAPPKTAPSSSPCVTSVYVNACGKK